MIPDAIENIVAGLLHVEGEGVAAVPDLDEGETLKEVLDGQEGRTQHLPPRTLFSIITYLYVQAKLLIIFLNEFIQALKVKLF